MFGVDTNYRQAYSQYIHFIDLNTVFMVARVWKLKKKGENRITIYNWDFLGK